MSQRIKTYDFRRKCRRQNVLLVPRVNCVFQNKATQLAMHFRVLEVDTHRRAVWDCIFVRVTRVMVSF